MLFTLTGGESHFAEKRHVEHGRLRAMGPPRLGRRSSEFLRKTLASGLDRGHGAGFHCVVAARPRASLLHTWEQTNDGMWTRALRRPLGRQGRTVPGEDGADARQDGALPVAHGRARLLRS